MASASRDEQQQQHQAGWRAAYSRICQPVEASSLSSDNLSPFTTLSSLGPILVDSEASETRDHCANERTFLSYLRLSIWMTIIAIAIALSFHLQNEPTQIELRMARPVGLTFLVLSVLVLSIGVGNYIKTLNHYSRRAAIVQTGRKTQLVIGLVAFSITSTSIVLLVVSTFG